MPFDKRGDGKTTNTKKLIKTTFVIPISRIIS
jgi:hypothetical protein